MTILRKIMCETDRGRTLVLSCGCDASARAIRKLLGAVPAHGWVPCSACAGARDGRRLAAAVGIASARQVPARLTGGR